MERRDTARRGDRRRRAHPARRRHRGRRGRVHRRRPRRAALLLRHQRAVELRRRRPAGGRVRSVRPAGRLPRARAPLAREAGPQRPVPASNPVSRRARNESRPAVNHPRMPPHGPVPPDADQALLARAASGELEAFGAIYERYQHAVFRFACAMTGSRDAAADITHDAFLAVLADASRFDPDRASLSTYLYGVVRNLCRERLRRVSRLQPIDAGVFDRPADRACPDRPGRRRRAGGTGPARPCRAAVALPRASSALRCSRPVVCRRGRRSSAPRCRRCARASIAGVSAQGVAVGADGLAAVAPPARTVRHMTTTRPTSDRDSCHRAWAAFVRHDAA